MKQIGVSLAASLLVVAQASSQSAPTSNGTASTGTMSKALGLTVFPAKNQTAEQQQKDESDCYTWAKGQTNYDPVAPPPTPTVVATGKQKGGAVKGAARGAAAGAVVGGVAGDAETGAAAGATAGAVKGRRQQKATQQQSAEKAKGDQAAAAAAPREQYKKAFQTCLQGKG